MTAPRNRVRGIAELPSARVEDSPGNWRTHDAAQKAKMAGLLGEVGSVSELVVWIPNDGAREALRRLPGPDGFAAWLATFAGKVRLLDGHMRRGLRGKKLGVQVTDLDAREASLVLATFDPIGAQAGRDDALLRSLLEGQRSENRGLEDLLADLRASVGGPAAAEPDLDEGPSVDPTDEILAKWTALGCVAGSLWEIASADGQRVHRVLCGDARKPEDVARLMQGRRAKLGQHDPPYGIDIVMGHASRIGSGKREGNSTVPRGKFRPVEGDREEPDVGHLLMASDVVVLWGANNFPGALPPSNHWIVWDKKTRADGAPTHDNQFGDAELAFALGPSSGGRVRIIRHLWTGFSRASEHGDKRLAPTQKPIAVVAKPIEWWTAPDDLVADWYCGSGTTFLASEKLGRVCYGMDITARYVAVTLERLARAGLVPRLVR